MADIRTEFERDFSGWDFSHLSETGRMVESLLPWNYGSIIKGYFPGRDTLLDMGTGGGEFLTSLEGLPPKVFATEGYAPNYEIAKKNLESIGAIVKTINDDNLIPYSDEAFDIIINRHEEFDPAEVARVLSNGGFFITQQVGGINDINLNISLDTAPSMYLSWNLFSAVKSLEKAGMHIIKKQESYGFTRFFDVAALAYYLKCIPWQIKDFTPEKYEEQLIALNSYIEENGYYDLINHRFIIIAQKKDH